MNALVAGYLYAACAVTAVVVVSLSCLAGWVLSAGHAVDMGVSCTHVTPANTERMGLS